MKKITVKVVEKFWAEHFVTKPSGWAVEIVIGAIRFVTTNFWLREQDARRRAQYVAEKLGARLEEK
jgi:hypothetical protein